MKFFKGLIYLAIFSGMIFTGWKIIGVLDIPIKIIKSVDTTVNLTSGLSRVEISRIIGKALGWDESEISAFASTYGQMQWAEFNAPFISVLSKRLEWKEDHKEIFATNSTKYFTRPELDFFGKIYVPGTYTITKESSLAQIAGLLIGKTKDVEAGKIESFIAENISEDELNNVEKFVQSEYELLPDLVPLPPQDLQISKVDGKILLLFTTVYYNQGRGPLELLADPKTKGVMKDIERNVFQRIYLPDGKHRDRVAGTFLWHQSHLHYHFADFIIYDLEAVDVTGTVPDLSGIMAKSTFCIRDISKVVLDIPDIKEDAVYEICGKEKQGISVGWGDSYFYTYPDQNLNISDLPSGIYRLTFKANPDNRFDEMTRDNNTSSALIAINMEELKVLVLESVPDKIPEFKHVYPVQENCPACTL